MHKAQVFLSVLASVFLFSAITNPVKAAKPVDLNLFTNENNPNLGEKTKVYLLAKTSADLQVNGILTGIRVPKDLNVSNLNLEVPTSFIFNHLEATDHVTYTQIEVMLAKKTGTFFTLKNNDPIISFDIDGAKAGSFAIDPVPTINTSVLDLNQVELFEKYNPSMLTINVVGTTSTLIPTPTIIPTIVPTPIISTPTPEPTIIPSPTPIVPTPSPTPVIYTPTITPTVINPTPITVVVTTLTPSVIPTPTISPTIVPTISPKVSPTPKAKPTPGKKRKAEIFNLRCATNKLCVHSINGLFFGNRIYTDRIYKFRNIPNILLNDDYIRIANNDKFSDSNNLVTFDIDVNSEIYIAHDIRIKDKPQWLKNFEQTSLEIEDNYGIKYTLYKKIFTEGKVTLGKNQNDKQNWNSSNYFVIINPVD